MDFDEGAFFTEVDSIRRQFHANQLSRERAIERVLDLGHPALARMGAEDLLDHPKQPTKRFAESVRRIYRNC